MCWFGMNMGEMCNVCPEFGVLYHFGIRENLSNNNSSEKLLSQMGL